MLVCIRDEIICALRPALLFLLESHIFRYRTYKTFIEIEPIQLWGVVDIQEQFSYVAAKQLATLKNVKYKHASTLLIYLDETQYHLSALIKQELNYAVHGMSIAFMLNPLVGDAAGVTSVCVLVFCVY